jgi:hypothetical protein
MGMMRHRTVTIHDGALWTRLNQIIKVEAPITFEGVKHWCPDVRASDLETTLREMRQARCISVSREWRGNILRETYHYGVCDVASVVISEGEANMIIRRSGEQITFSFERKEWNIRNGDAVRAFVDDLKTRVPKERRDYDSSVNEWTINKDFAPIVDELKEKHFTDQRQAALF